MRSRPNLVALTFAGCAVVAAACGGNVATQAAAEGDAGPGDTGGSRGSSSSGADGATNSGSSSGSPGRPDSSTGGPDSSVSSSSGGPTDAGNPFGGDAWTSGSSDGYVPPVTCVDAGFTGTYDDGSGFNGLTPQACTAPTGTRHTFSSVSAVVALLSQQPWFDCGGDNLLSLLGGGQGIQFTAAGHFTALATDMSDTLVASSNTTNGTGTYVVTDTSATNGPNTYDLQLTTSFGGAYDAQIIAHDSPSTLALALTSQPPDVLAPALTWKPRAGICGPAFGPPVAFANPSEVAAALVGKWIWCAGGQPPPSPTGPGAFGIEFGADGTYTELDEDDQGNLVAGVSGPFNLGASQSGPPAFGIQLVTPTGGSLMTSMVLSECLRSLALGNASNPDIVLLPSP